MTEDMMKIEPPEFLYKYRHLQGEHREWTKRIITHSEIYFSSPAKFNDPFDCNIFIQPISKEERLKDWEIFNATNPELIKRKRPDILNDDGKTKKEVLEFLAQHDTEKEYEKKLQKEINNSGVFSFSATDKHVLLWSHYADGHKGLCLKFKSIPLYSSFFLRHVSYKKNRPRSQYPVNSAASNEKTLDFVKNVIFTKAEDWKYEKEWRCFELEIDEKAFGFGIKSFNKEILIGIIFGCEMLEEDKIEIWKCVKKHNPTIKLEQAEKTSGEFSLAIKPYKP